MIHPLVRKELREHLWVLMAMWTLCGIGLLALLVGAREAGSPLVAYRQLVVVFGILLSLALANRLVVREYGGRTQLFLETLPVGRGQVLIIKWLTGAAFLLLPMALGFGITLLVASGEVLLGPEFVLLLALRGLSFLLFFYALAFAIGLTGRYRYILWAAIFLLAFIADSTGQLGIQHWAPLQLIHDTMPFHRGGVPARWFWITWLLTAALLGLTLLLALGSRGSWVVALSRRMSLREKATVAAAFLSVLYVITLIDDRRPKPPFELQDALVTDSDLPRVSVARVDDDSDEDALNAARRVAMDLQRARDVLGLEALPAVAVLPDASLDADLYLLAELPDSDGVVVRAAVGDERFDPQDFRAFVLARVLDWHSRGRVTREQRRWLLEGYAQQQVMEAQPVRRELLALRAAFASQVVAHEGVPLQQALGNWLTTRERLGDCLADALAWQATEVLAHALGAERFGSLTRALLGQRASSSMRAFLEEESLRDLLRQAQGPSVEDLGGMLQAQVREDQLRLADTLGHIRLWPVSIEAVPMRGSAFELRYEVPAVDGHAPPSFAVLYARIGPWEAEVPRVRLARVDAFTGGVLPTSFPRGARVLIAVEMPVPELSCTVRMHARRWELQ